MNSSKLFNRFKMVQIVQVVQNCHVQLSVYPNPNNGNFVLKGIQSSVFQAYELIDAKGQAIESGVKELKGDEILFNFSENNYEPGSYILRLTSDSKQTKVKVVIE